MNTLKEKDLRVTVNLPIIKALMKKEFPERKGDEKSQRNDIDLKARKTKEMTSEIFMFAITIKLV